MMLKQYIPVLTDETRIIELSAETSALGTECLGKEIAITCYNPATKRVGIARTKDLTKIELFLKDVMESDFTDPLPICDVRIVGGETQDQGFILGLIRLMHQMDDGRNTINLASAATGGKPHPDSFKITALDGRLAAL